MKLKGPVGQKPKKKVTFAVSNTAKATADGSSGYVGLAPKPRDGDAALVQNPIIRPTLKLNQSIVGPMTQSQVYPEPTGGPILCIPKPDLPKSGIRINTCSGFSEVQQ